MPTPPISRPGGLRHAQALADAELISSNALEEVHEVAARYSVAVTPIVRSLIDSTDPDDPVARQFVPSAEELVETPTENADPIGDDTFSPVPGIVHRYRDRVLLKLLHTCPVYCRYCFRRERVGTIGSAALPSSRSKRRWPLRTRESTGRLGGDPDRGRPPPAVAAA